MALALPPTSTYSKSMRTTRYVLIVAALTGFTGTAFAWSNHAMVSYRALERMPELSVQVAAEPLEAFLKNEDKAIEALLRDDEDWASKAVDMYPPLPAALAYRADPAKSDAQRRKEFLAALRVSPESRLALYVQPDPWGPAPDPARLLPATAVNALDKSEEARHVFVRIAPGDMVSALAVVASASDEPDYGMDLNLWSDSPSEAGKNYGFGPIPFGNPTLSFATQAPFHMGFFHEPSIMYKAAPFLKRTYPLLRGHQYTSLDSHYPAWTDRYVRDVVSKEAYDAGAATDRSLVNTLPARYVSDPGFDFGVQSAKIDLIKELAAIDPAQRAHLDTTIAELLGHFGVHSRALVRSMLDGRPAK